MRVTSSPFASRLSFSPRPSSQLLGSSGSELQMVPSTISMGGRSACRPRAMMDLAVPRLPEMAIPPSAGSMAPSRSADLMFSWPMTAARGNAWRTPADSIGRSPSASICAASATRWAMTSGSVTAARTTDLGPFTTRTGRARRLEAPEPCTWERRAAGAIGDGSELGSARRSTARGRRRASERKARFGARWSASATGTCHLDDRTSLRPPQRPRHARGERPNHTERGRKMLVG